MPIIPVQEGTGWVVSCQPRLQSEFEHSLSYVTRPSCPYIYTYVHICVRVSETTLKSCMSFYHWVPLGWQEHIPNLGPGVILILHNYEWYSANNAAHQTSLHLSWALPDQALEEQSLGWCGKQVQLFFFFYMLLIALQKSSALLLPSVRCAHIYCLESWLTLGFNLSRNENLSAK